MFEGISIRPPFFEFGPKAYIYGEKVLKIAKKLDELAIKYDLDIILTPQYTDIPIVSKSTERILVFAQHMDCIPIGVGVGSVLPEAIKEAGAVGVMLNHAEKPLPMPVIKKTIQRADEVGLATIVCANTLKDIMEIAKMSPNIIVAEPTELIGTGQISSKEYIQKSIEIVKNINPKIHVLQGAGISNGRDVRKVIELGAMATGCSSGIIKAPDPEAMAEEMIYSLRKAWDEFHTS